MSQMAPDPDDEPTDDDALAAAALEATFRADTDLLIERYPDFEDAARQLGLYAEGHEISSAHTPLGPKAALVVGFDIGNVAFSDRVQHPENVTVDQAVREMELDTAADEWIDTREQIRRNLAAGRDPLDDGDDES